MNTIDRNQLIDQILTQRRAMRMSAPVQAPTRSLPAVITPPASEISVNLRPAETVMQGLAAAQPRLISESVDTMERGYRRTQIFRQSDGRNFIRNEEVTLTERGMRRVVSQENPSGSKARFEDTLERQADGSFRRTVRHIDETGALATKVEDNKNGIAPFILSGGSYTPPAAPYDTTRGVYYDQSV